ncbi:MAG: hypothetical protein AB1757_06470 [Acidobacteriota bacterium]
MNHKQLLNGLLILTLVLIAQMYTALQTSVAGKSESGKWQPVTAIRRADQSGNPDITSDASRSSRIPTPPYPIQTENMMALSTAQATILAQLFRCDDIRLQHTSSFAVLTAEAARRAASISILTTSPVNLSSAMLPTIFLRILCNHANATAENLIACSLDYQIG